MTKFYRSLMLVAIIACFGNSAEAMTIGQALGIQRYDAGAKPSQGILGVEFGSQTSAASIKAAPVTVSLKLADDCSDEITVSTSKETRARAHEDALGGIAGIATADKGVATSHGADGFFAMRNGGPGIGAVAQEHSRARVLQSPVEFIHVIDDMHPQQMATVEHGHIPVDDGIQVPPRAADASLHGAIVLEGEQVPGEPGCTSCKCPPCRYNPWELAGLYITDAYLCIVAIIWWYKQCKKNPICKRDVTSQEPNVQ
jgi:hypothetical protein